MKVEVGTLEIRAGNWLAAAAGTTGLLLFPGGFVSAIAGFSKGLCIERGREKKEIYIGGFHLFGEEYGQQKCLLSPVPTNMFILTTTALKNPLFFGITELLKQHDTQPYLGRGILETVVQESEAQIK